MQLRILLSPNDTLRQRIVGNIRQTGMSTDYWVALEVNLADSVVANRITARTAVVRACQDYPLAPVPHLVLGLSSMVTVLEEEWLSGSLEEQRQLLEVYRTVIALSADLAVLDLRTIDRKTCNDLLTYWEDTDDMFFVVPEA